MGNSDVNWGITLLNLIEYGICKFWWEKGNNSLNYTCKLAWTLARFYKQQNKIIAARQILILGNFQWYKSTGQWMLTNHTVPLLLSPLLLPSSYWSASTGNKKKFYQRLCQRVIQWGWEEGCSSLIFFILVGSNQSILFAQDKYQ